VLVERVRTNLLTASDGNVAGHRYAALHRADQLELFNSQLRGYNRRIDELLTQHPDHETYLSFPATGRVIAAELCAEIGEDRDRYPTPQVLLAEAGAAPVTLASGKVRRVHIRWACNHRLRSATTTWAHVLKRIDPPSRSRYLAKMERGATYHGALRAVSASWLRVLWRCWLARRSDARIRPRSQGRHAPTAVPLMCCNRHRPHGLEPLSSSGASVAGRVWQSDDRDQALTDLPQRRSRRHPPDQPG
jgi:hypothetical protein